MRGYLTRETIERCFFFTEIFPGDTPVVGSEVCPQEPRKMLCSLLRTELVPTVAISQLLAAI